MTENPDTESDPAQLPAPAFGTECGEKHRGVPARARESAWPEATCNAARALFDDAAYREMVALVSRAQESVRLQFYLFGGPVAEEMIDLLVAQQARGVTIQVTLDRGLGKDLLPQVRRECRAAYRRLLSERLDVTFSDPRPPPGLPFGRSAPAHHKFLIVDDREALVGGMNLGTPFFRHHDVMVHLQGPVAAELAAHFEQDRRLALLPAPVRPEGLRQPALAPYAGAHSRVRILHNQGTERRDTRAVVLRQVQTARSSIYVAMSEMGRTEVLAELLAAHRRGVDVKVLLDPQEVGEYLPAALRPLQNRLPQTVLNSLAIRDLIAAGIVVRLFAVGPNKAFALLHLKLALFDGERAVVGSTNWTRAGFGWVGETDVELCGGPVIGELHSQFLQDWQEALPAAHPSRFGQALCRLYERGCQ